MGEGPNHSLYAVYIDGAFWGTLDGYSASSGTRQIAITLNQPGLHLLEIRSRSRHSWQARTAGGFNPATYTLRFVSLTESGEYDVHDIAYTYDAISRLQQADYDNGGTVYDYDYDVVGNLVNNNGTTRTYNAVNQLINDGTNSLSYDRNGNMLSDGVNSYAWDQANRMLSVGNTSYKYDGASNRIQQTVNSVVTDYLNDVQPGLTKLLRQDDGTNIEHFVHAPRGIHAVDDGTSWNYYLQDGLGSVRGLVDNMAVVQQTHEYGPYGNYIGTAPTDAYFGFTGEQTQGNGQVYLRARYYTPSMGIFPSLDPDEGMTCTPMSLNGYSYVHGNPIMNTDPTGMTCECDKYISPWNFQAYIDCLANPANQHEETPTPAPTATPSCGGYELDPCDKIYLAHLSAAEASLGGEGITSKATLAAVMLSQINRFKRGGQFYGISTGTSYITSGRDAFQSQRQHLDTLIRDGAFTGISSIGDINTSNQYRVYHRLCSDGALIMPNPPGFQEALDMAKSMSCISNPLANFDFSGFGINSREQSELEKIAGNILFTEEKSFCTSVLDVIDEWQADSGYGERITNLIPNMYPTSVALFRGSGRRSVMVHDATAFRNPHVNWQCDQTPGQRMVWLVTSDPSSPLANRTGCKRCNDGTFTFENGFVTRCEGPEVNTCPIA